MMRADFRSAAAIRLLFAVAACCAVVAGCAKDEPVGPPSTGATVVPGVGSRFVFATYLVDTNDVEKPGSRAFDTVTVVQSGLRTGGKTDVIAMRYASTGEIAYYHYESNGDISFAVDQSDGVWPAWTWHTFPVGGHGRVAMPTLDTNQTGNGTVRADTLIYLGAENQTVEGGTFACQKIRDQVTILTYRGGAVSTRIEYPEDYWYVQSLGFFVRYENDSREFDAATGAVIWKGEDYRMSLVSHVLK